jgi:hypothetical protein
MNRPTRSRDSAFTLIELLVGLSAGVGILAGAYLCLHAGFESRRAVEAHVDALQTARVALKLLAADLRAACPLSEEFEFVGMDREVGGMEADNLDFATHHFSPRRPGEGDRCEVSYFVDRSLETGGLSLWRRRDPTIDIEPLDGGLKEEIAPGLRGFKVEYYDGFSWYDSWGKQEQRRVEETERAQWQTNLYGLPDAVRITVAVGSPGAGRARAPRSEDVNPPLVLRTTVFLPLAERALQAAYDGSPGEGGSDADTEEAGVEATETTIEEL